MSASIEISGLRSRPKGNKCIPGYGVSHVIITFFSSLIQPITALLCKGSSNLIGHQSVRHLTSNKRMLEKVFSSIDYNLPFEIHCDAIGYLLGAVLIQPRLDGDRVISYLSRSLSKQKNAHPMTERECLWAVEKLRSYFDNTPGKFLNAHL